MNFESFKSAPWFDKSFQVIIGGLGNIGSWTTLLFARMGYDLYLYDMDKVEERNVGSQFYSPEDVGKLKTVATHNRIKTTTGNQRINVFGKYDESSLVGNIMISAFDNMKARKIMFEKWLNYQKDKKERPKHEVNIFIDGRSLAEGGYVYAVRSISDAKKYSKELFNDDEVEQQICSYKSTSHNGAMIGSLITSVLINHICNKKAGIVASDPLGRPVPFKIDYQLPLLMFHS
jgi:hypothetical protein